MKLLLVKCLFLSFFFLIPTHGGGREIYEAIKDSNLSELQSMLESGVDFNKPIKHGKTPLIHSVLLGRYQIAKFFIEHHVDLNRIDKEKKTALIHAISLMDTGIAFLILQHFPNVNLQDHAGRTALQHAITSGQGEMVKYLLGKGADPTIVDKWGNAPFRYASFFAQREIQETLLFFRDTKKVTGLDHPEIQIYLSLDSEDSDLIKSTFSNPGISKWMRNNSVNPMVLAAKFGNLASLKHIMQLFPEPEIKDSCINSTPLIAAIKNGRYMIVKALLDFGVDVNAVSKKKETALGASIYNEGLFKLVVSGGANTISSRTDAQLVIIKEKNLTLKKVKKKMEDLKKRKLPKSNQIPPELQSAFLCRDDSLPFLIGEKGVEPPVFTFRVQPKYPKAAIRSKTKGHVILQAILGKDGKIRNILILKGFQDWTLGFEYSAIEALKKWRFKPGTVDGKKTDIRMTVKLEFMLR